MSVDVPRWYEYAKVDKNGDYYIPEDAPDEIKRDFEEWQKEYAEAEDIGMNL